MPSGSSSALALAARLRALDDDALARLIRDRAVRSAGIRDWFDLAEALLDRASIQTALERLDRPTLAVLAASAELASGGSAPTATTLAERTGADATQVAARAATAVEWALLGEESGRYAPWDAVIDQLAAWPSFGLPSIEELLWAPAPAALAPVTPDDRGVVDRAAGELAFTTTGRVTEIVLELRREPARRLAKGGVALPETRRLAAATGVEVEDVPALLALAERAELVIDDGAALVAVADADDWLDRPGPQRWQRLASAWLGRLHPETRELLAERASAVWGDALLDYFSWFFPAGGDNVLPRIDAAAAEAELLGITALSTPSTPGATLLSDGAEAAASGMAELFPAEVDRVYLQHDLTIISPGPLAAALDARLRTMADAEGRGLASTYRVTGASLNRALTLGDTAADLREFLGGISLTGIPQPLEYLIADTAGRFGSLRVGSLDDAALDAARADFGVEAGARSYVRSDDPGLIGQLVVDQALSPLGLERAGEHRAVSRFASSVVYWSLVDARYPAVAEDADGTIHALSRRPRPAPVTGAGDDPAVALVTRLRGGGAASVEATGEAWIARQLELAVKAKAPVIVTVRMPDGSSVEFRLEPASVAGGRLRARDARADLERTLPLASITSVTALT